jgi:hypothetical protein
MNSKLLHAISADQVATCHRDGVVLLPGMFDGEWIDLLKQGLDANCDDVRIKFRECGMDPDHSAILTEHGLESGDRPGTDLYPQVWARA